jgi:hypothetical protein
VFMAEELQKGPAREEDAIERADRMISRPRPDAAIEGLVDTSDARGIAAVGANIASPVGLMSPRLRLGVMPKRSDGCPATRPTAQDR